MFTQIEVPTLKKVSRRPWDDDRKQKPDERRKGFDVELKKSDVSQRSKDMAQYRTKKMDIPDLKPPEKTKDTKTHDNRIDLPNLKHVTKKSAFDEPSQVHKEII